MFDLPIWVGVYGSMLIAGVVVWGAVATLLTLLGWLTWDC